MRRLQSVLPTYSVIFNHSVIFQWHIFNLTHILLHFKENLNLIISSYLNVHIIVTLLINRKIFSAANTLLFAYAAASSIVICNNVTAMFAI